MKKKPGRIERTVIYESEYICLYTDKVRLADGTIIEKYHQLHYPKESVAVVIFNENDDILFVKNYRYTLGRPEWEIPAGGIESGENATSAARREVLEETGCELKELEYLFSENPSHSMSDEIIHIFMAKVSAENDIQDKNEISEKRWFKKNEYLDLLRMNKTKDGVSMLAILYTLEFHKNIN